MAQEVYAPLHDHRTDSPRWVIPPDFVTGEVGAMLRADSILAAEWLPGHDHVRLIVHDDNQGMSEAYYSAFTDLRQRIVDGEISADDLIYTIDADGQHDLAVLEELQRIMLHEGLDALLVQRDLSGYPRYKQARQPAAVGVGVAVGRWPAARRRVRLPHLPRRCPRQRPRLLPGLPVLRDGRGRRRAVAARIQGAQRRARAGADLPVAHVHDRRRDRPLGHPGRGRAGASAAARSHVRAWPDTGQADRRHRGARRRGRPPRPARSALLRRVVGGASLALGQHGT